MRIYSRQKFMELPAGTIFAKGKPWVFCTLSVKGETSCNDFICRDLVDIESTGSADHVERLEAMNANAKSYPLNQDYGRDGCFDQNDLFLVYEPADLEELRKVIANAV